MYLLDSLSFFGSISSHFTFNTCTMYQRSNFHNSRCNLISLVSFTTVFVSYIAVRLDMTPVVIGDTRTTTNIARTIRLIINVLAFTFLLSLSLSDPSEFLPNIFSYGSGASSGSSIWQRRHHCLSQVGRVPANVARKWWKLSLPSLERTFHYTEYLVTVCPFA